MTVSFNTSSFVNLNWYLNYQSIHHHWGNYNTTVDSDEMEEGTEIAGVALGQARRRRDQSTPLDAGGNVRRDLGVAALRGTGPGREYSRVPGSVQCCY